MSLFDAYEWAFDKAMRRAEDKRLDPPAERLIACHFCNATGSKEDWDCDVCDGTGYLSEPEEWKSDAYWSAKYDQMREERLDK